MKPSVDAVKLAGQLRPGELVGKTVVVIDVLRASTTIIAALDAGALGVIAKRDIESARQCAGSIDRALLGGERSAAHIEGFDLGNSPLEYSPAVVDGRVIVLCTTNGTKAVKIAMEGELVMIGAITNRAAVVDEVIEAGRDIMLVCSGTDGEVSEEDCFAAGLIAELLDGWGTLTERARELSINAGTALCGAGDIESVLFRTFHGHRLHQLGHASDIHAAARMDSSKCVPMLDKGGMLSLMR